MIVKIFYFSLWGSNTKWDFFCLFQNVASSIKSPWRWKALTVVCYVWFYIGGQWPEVQLPCYSLQQSDIVVLIIPMSGHTSLVIINEYREVYSIWKLFLAMARFRVLRVTIKAKFIPRSTNSGLDRATNHMHLCLPTSEWHSAKNSLTPELLILPLKTEMMLGLQTISHSSLWWSLHLHAFRKTQFAWSLLLIMVFHYGG